MLVYNGASQSIIILVAEGLSEEVFRRRSSIHQTPGLRTLPTGCMVRSQIYVWQSQIEIEYYSVAYFAKGGAHTRYVNA